MTARSCLLSGVFLLTLTATAMVVVETRLSSKPEDAAAEFHHLLGGLGFGPALDLSVCPFGFDPRLDGSCANGYAPLPGGACFCPHHAGSVLEYSPPPRRNSVWLVEQSDAPSS